MKIIFISPIAVIIFISLIVILFYLYRTSELFNKKRLLITIMAIILIFIFINSYFFVIHREPNQKFKLAFIPLSISGDQRLDHDWLQLAVPDMIAKQLYRTVTDQAIISPIDRTYRMFHPDSIANSDYLEKQFTLLNFPHYFYGSLYRDSAVYTMTYRIHAMHRNSFSDTVSFTLEQLLPTVRDIAQSLLHYFSFPKPALISPMFSETTEAVASYYEGYHSFLHDNYSVALEKLTKAITIDSSFAEAYTLAADCNFNLGIAQHATNGSESIENFDKAKSFLNKAMTLDSTYDDNYRLLGAIHIYNERWSQAEFMLAQALKLNANNPRLYLPISRLHKDRFRKLGFNDEERLFQRAIFLDPFYEDAYLMLADLYLFQNKRDHAIASLKQYLAVQPNSIPALMSLGKIFIMRNEMIDIVSIFNRIIELDPKNSDAYYNLGILYYNAKDYENASRFFQRAIALDNHLNSYLYLAFISEIDGKIDEAVEYLRKRIRYKTGPDDEFAEEARKHLYKLVHADSSEEKRK